MSIVLISACSEYEPAKNPRTPPSETSANTKPANSDDVVTPVRECYIGIAETLATVQDDASAQAAAPKLAKLAEQFKHAFNNAMKAAKTAVASRTPIPGSGKYTDTSALFSKMQSEIERVYHSPAGQHIHSELRRILDTLVECSMYAERDRIQKWIQNEKLNL